MQVKEERQRETRTHTRAGILTRTPSSHAWAHAQGPSCLPAPQGPHLGPRGGREATQTCPPWSNSCLTCPTWARKASWRTLRGVRARAGRAPGPALPARTTRTTRRCPWEACGTRTCSYSGARCPGPCGSHTPNRATRAPGVLHGTPLTPQAHGRRPARASAPHVARAARLNRGL